MHAALAMMLAAGLLLAAPKPPAPKAHPGGWTVGVSHGSSGSGRADVAAGSSGSGTSNCVILGGGFRHCIGSEGSMPDPDPISGLTPIEPGEPAAPAISPFDLLQRALAELQLPLPKVHTAPPRGKPALTGIPHWYWLAGGSGSGQWRTITKRVEAGPVWAEVIATPQRLVITPGTGLPQVTCPGPGTPYRTGRPAKGQHSKCTHTYTESSANQPGARHTVTAAVVWGAVWRGSGGAGGPLAPITRTSSFRLPVAEGQALVVNGGAS